MSSNDTIGVEELGVDCSDNDVDNDAGDNDVNNNVFAFDDDDRVAGGCNCGGNGEALGGT